MAKRVTQRQILDACKELQWKMNETSGSIRTIGGLCPLQVFTKRYMGYLNRAWQLGVPDLIADQFVVASDGRLNNAIIGAIAGAKRLRKRMLKEFGLG